MVLFGLVTNASALYQVGDRVKNACWVDVKGAKYCVDDGVNLGHYQVLLFNAAWCGPCIAEFTDMVPKLEKFTGKKVTFISLGDSDKALPAWQSKFGIDKAKATWVVASSPRDYGRDYFDQPLIPNVTILAPDGKVKFKSIAPGADKIISVIEGLKP